MRKKTKVASYRRNKLAVSFKIDYDESKLFLRTSLRFYSALAILEPQIYVVVEQFGAENISLLSGRFVVYYFQSIFHMGKENIYCMFISELSNKLFALTIKNQTLFYRF